MKSLTIEEFQRTAGLSDAAVLWLLRKKPELWSLADGQLTIDAGSADLASLIEAMAAREGALLEEQRRLVTERIARIIGNHLDALFTEAAAELSRGGRGANQS